MTFRAPPSRVAAIPLVLAGVVVGCVGCGSSGAHSASGSSSGSGPTFNVPDRVAGARTPLTAACDTLDPVRCLLPWPSSTFTKVDTTTQTGLRVDVAPSSLIQTADSPAPLNIANGFSVVTPLVTGFTATVGDIPVATTGQGPVRLLVAQPGDPTLGTSLPLRFDVEQDMNDSGDNESFVFAYPLHPLHANTDYVGVVLDDLPVTAGGPVQPSRGTLLALGRATPETLAEAQLAAYHAPTRALLKTAGIDPAHVLVVWDFTTRSTEDPLDRLTAMKKAAVATVTSNAATITLNMVDTSGPPPIAAVVEGVISNIPEFISETGPASLKLDANGLPIQIGTRTAPFRVVLPVGTGSYPVVMYGHGTGGTYEDTTLDANIAGIGAAKVAIQFDGWTQQSVLNTFLGLTSVFEGCQFATQILMQALADGSAIQASLGTSLGDTLSAPTLMGTTNPTAGRRPDTTRLIWAGGSLGGIMSLVNVSSDATLKSGVLNVPGAAWTHFVPKSIIFTMIEGFLVNPYDGSLNALQAVAMSQGLWDEIDGAAWSSQLAGRGTSFLIQESIGDPVVPNPGSEMVAVVTAATQLGAVLVPIAAGIPTAPIGQSVNDASGITQYKVTSSNPYDIHGFAAQDTPAGAAARSQIQSFVATVYAGAPVITVPAGCDAGSCDFSGE